MKPFIEQRLYTHPLDQTVLIQPNEEHNGIVLVTREGIIGGPQHDARLYLSLDEADALCKLIQQMKEHITE